MQKKAHHYPALICAALGNSIFGFSFMFSRIALDVADPFVMLMYRFDLAFLTLSIITLFAARKSRRGSMENSWMRFDLRGRSLLPLIGLGLIQPVAYFLCESYGISLTNATFSGVMIALIPIIAILGGALVLHEIPRLGQIGFCLLSIAGVVLMTLQQQADGQIQLLGVVLLFGAVVTGAAFNVLSRKLSTQYSVLERTEVMMGMAALIFTVLAFWQTQGDAAQLLAPLKSAGFLASMVYLSLCSSIVAFMALNYANNDLPVAKATAFENLTTIISLFAGVIFLHEPFSAVSLLASVMIVAGIWGTQRT